MTLRSATDHLANEIADPFADSVNLRQAVRDWFSVLTDELDHLEGSLFREPAENHRGLLAPIVNDVARIAKVLPDTVRYEISCRHPEPDIQYRGGPELHEGDRVSFGGPFLTVAAVRSRRHPLDAAFLTLEGGLTRLVMPGETVAVMLTDAELLAGVS